MRAFLLSFRYAFAGLRHLFHSERNAWVHLFAAVTVVALGFVYDITSGEWIAVVLSIAIVTAAEAFNTAIEKLTDLVSPQRDARAGLIKDLAAGAVLLTSIGALITGLIIFLPKITTP